MHLPEAATEPTVIRAVRFAARFFVASLALALPLAGALGCGTPARAPGPPGATLILLENRVTGPCQLKWANARVDDRPLGLVTLAPPGAEPAPLDRIILTPGEHTIALAVATSCPAADGSEQAGVLQVTQPVYLREGGGKITVSLANKADSDAGIEASFAVAGGHVLAPRADGGEIDCRARLPMDWALCRTEAALARGQAQRDVILVVCVSDKLREMRLLADTLGPQSAAHATDDVALRNVTAEAVERVLWLALEAEQCIGEEVMTEGGTNVDRAAPPTSISMRKAE